MDLSSLLDISLDQLADLPEFKQYSPGAHRVKTVFKAKEVNKHPAVEIKFTLVETCELVDPASAACEPGTECSVVYLLDNEFGQGNFKSFMAPICAHFGENNLSKAVEAAQGMELVIVTDLRKDKNDPNKQYLTVVSVVV